MPGSSLSSCPGRQALQAFALGRLSEAEIDSVAEHLDTCPSCASLLNDLHASPEADSVQERVRRCLLAPAPAELGAWDAIEGQLTVPERPGVVSPTDFRVDQMLGTTLGGYQLVERLGKGGMGVVYRAIQLTLHRQVAVKTLHAGALAAPVLAARLRIEGAALARLDHPGIVRVLDLGEQQGTPFLVMELVEGQTLSQRLLASRLDPRPAADLVRDLAVAVDYAHSRGVLHRDLKPSNVLLDTAGTPRVADFGLAKLLDRDDGLTATDLVPGTPAYMSPEQAGGLTLRLRPTTDVWAMGIILYECLTGRPPFKADSKPATLELVRTARLQPPSRWRAGIPPGLEAICLHCLDKDPKRRYPSAKALADDLNRWLTGQQTHARRRRLAHRAAALALAVLLLTGAAGWLALAGRAGPQPAVAPAVVEEPEVPLREGKPQVLLGATGRPAQLRQLTGKPIRGDAPLAADGSFQVETTSQCLLELLADPGHDRYRLSAQVRHLQSDRSGRIGLYVGRQAVPRKGAEEHSLICMDWNDVLSLKDHPVQLPALQNRPLINYVRLAYKDLSDDQVKPTLDSNMWIWTGCPFTPAGADRGSWREVELTITPTYWTVRLGQTLARVTTAKMRSTLDQLARESFPARGTGLKAPPPAPTIRSRGGIGLIISSGKGQFRNVRLTPLFPSE